MLNWVLRYRPVIRILDDMGAREVLDVGSGWYGLSWYWQRHVVQTDLNFAGEPPLDGERAGTVDFVPASAEDLPFPDDAFDYSVSVDMIEHLPEHLRSQAIKELARVSRRGFIVAYPTGGTAARVDQILALLWTLTPRVFRPIWLREHMTQAAYPDRQFLINAIPDGWRIEREASSGNVLIQLLVVYLEVLPFFRSLARILERWGRSGRIPGIVDARPAYRTIWLVTPRT